MSNKMTAKEEMRRQEMMSVLAHPLLSAYIGPNAEEYLTMWRAQVENRNYYTQPYAFAFC